ncbi:MAG: S8 family serine peptidase, partial [Planctomycetales bacterium]|nr:S8 family serine peptidase [Planctomycetales bacterium]
MTAPSGQPDPQRRSRFETFEDRLVLSGQPVEMFSLDPLESPELQQQYELAPALDSVNLSTQVAGLANRYGLTGAGQTVAVIDSGIAYDHVALGGGYGNRVVGGWDFAEGDADPYDDGPAGFHGTHVAGIIGSDDATYQGVAPGADLVALRVFNDAGQ